MHGTFGGTGPYRWWLFFEKEVILTCRLHAQARFRWHHHLDVGGVRTSQRYCSSEYIWLSLRAGAEEVWKSRWHTTQGFEKHWQGDEVFQNLFTGALSIIAENGDDDDATLAFDLELRKTTRTAKAITAAEELLSTDDYEPVESEAWTTLPVQGVNDLQHTKGSDAGPDADPDAASVDDQTSATVELTQEVLDNVPKPEKCSIAIKRWSASVKGPGADEDEDEDEDEEGWSHVSDDRLRDDEPNPTIQSGKVETRSMASRWLFN
ncbi:hypothetical protein FOVG_19911 [Fusarium oxysporum f. sp. pisi HDV247]|uniref:Uncharacterized protein n=1 Tax=Fusarium oxysporum f. sp. pisi HDV247 TaxID=1080344 RepID=W9N782_FUSOX|nr:hypothetical protein FOVG_19911 [Fusarium oxysporum f. sp. pisi HDV247]